MKLNTPIEVFEYILNEEGYLERKVFICICIGFLFDNDFIDVVLYDKCKDILTTNKPNDNNIYREFTKSKYWKGLGIWWYVIYNQKKEYQTYKDRKQALEQKRLYLKALIEQLKKEDGNDK